MTFIVLAILISSLVLTPSSADSPQNKSSRKAANESRKTKSSSSTKEAAGKPEIFEAEGDEGIDPDLPPGASGTDKEAFFQARGEAIAKLRGLEPGKPFDPSARGRAIAQMAKREADLRKDVKLGLRPESISGAWVELGPNPIPNGQTSPSVPVSGRVTAIEIHPINPNVVYAGTAQGGVFRSTNGGTSWNPIFDNAQSLAIGSLALAPSDPRILYIGTGEANGSSDSFAGVGLYRIDNAETTTGAISDLVGPINPLITTGSASGGSLSYNAFSGRSISKILVHPTNPAIVFVGTAGAVIGIGGDIPFNNSLPPLGLRGLYRSTNATSALASIAFERIAVSQAGGTVAGVFTCFDTPCTGNRNVNDMVFEPGNPNNLVLWLNGVAGTQSVCQTPPCPPNPIIAGIPDGGIYRTSNALASPGSSVSFTQTFSTTTSSASNGRGALAIYKSGGQTVLYTASGEDSSGTSCTAATDLGALRKSTDGGITWSSKLPGGGGFCQAQCFYNIGLAIQPGAQPATDKILLGGNVTGSGASALCRRMQATSTDGGVTFTNHAAGVHADTHAIVFAPSNPSIVYRGDDGGVFKSTDGGDNWASLNNAGFRATQFMGIALHPNNRDFSLGGTQDNGTNLLQTGPVWTRVNGGDGGYTLIDQNSVNTTNVVMYHTFFCRINSQIGYAEGEVVGGGFTLRGCFDGSTPGNGIPCTDTVNFYAPLAQGPGNPNTVYFGTDRLYRSSNKGLNHTIVSQAPIVSNVPISSIAISPQDDNFRIVGLDNGALFFTTTGSSTLANLDPGGAVPDRYVGRVFFDPNNKDIAYIALGSYFGSTSGTNSHFWRLANLSGSPSFSAINGSGVTGLPDVPINAIAIDPLNSNAIYVGTDIGVFFTSDGGVSWNPFGTGLPRVAVFGMGIQNSSRTLRISTHGRGMWEIPAAQTSTLFSFSASNFNANEGDVFTTITVTRTGDLTGAATVDFASSNGSASQIRDYEVANGTLTFAASDSSKTFRILIVNDTFPESSETVNLNLSNPTNGILASPSTATVTIADNDSGGSTSPVSRQFVSNLVGADEVPATPNVVKGNGGIFQLSNDELSAKVSLLFSGLTGDETGAHVHAAAPGVNGPIIFPLPLGNPINNFVVNPTAQQVIDLRAGQQYMNVHSTGFQNGEVRGQLLWNPAEEADFFVRQAYFDFLSRVPDAGGFAFWQNEITQCQSDVQCLRNKRVDVSNAFFYELEFQQTAAYVLRLYRAAFGNNQPFPNPNPDANFPDEEKKLPSYAVFVADRARVIGGANLAQKQQDLANLFITRPEFTAKYPASLSTADQFVDAVLATIQSASGVNLTSQRANLITLFNSGGRGAVMYRLADDNTSNPIANQPFIDAEYNRTFVLGQYFGYLRRNPDISGFLFWLGQVNGAPLRDVPKQHAMVCSFITSAEYQFRFGPVASRNNNECTQ